VSSKQGTHYWEKTTLSVIINYFTNRERETFLLFNLKLRGVKGQPFLTSLLRKGKQQQQKKKNLKNQHFSVSRVSFSK